MDAVWRWDPVAQKMTRVHKHHNDGGVVGRYACMWSCDVAAGQCCPVEDESFVAAGGCHASCMLSDCGVVAI